MKDLRHLVIILVLSIIALGRIGIVLHYTIINSTEQELRDAMNSPILSPVVPPLVAVTLAVILFFYSTRKQKPLHKE
jgi:hypothetical protein